VRGRLVCSRHFPELLEGDTRVTREPIDVRPLKEIDQRVARHGRTHHPALEHERRADDPDTVHRRDDHRGPLRGLREVRHCRAHSTKMPGS
jgi:hypothetical protein